jgi:hypothetical protein
VTFLPSAFVRDAEYSSRRADSHLARFPEYPDPLFHLSVLGKYFFRNESLLHLRIEQYNRYLVVADNIEGDVSRDGGGIGHDEDDAEEDETSRFVEMDHRHYDNWLGLAACSPCLPPHFPLISPKHVHASAAGLACVQKV